MCSLTVLGGVGDVPRVSAFWRIALIGNLVALAGVVLGIVALAAGGGPRTVSNDNLHRAMLTLIGLFFVVLFVVRSFPKLGKK
jgi:hypothetical protein